MKILKILGIVVAVHVIAFFLMFISPGCSSTATKPAPVTMTPAAVEPMAPAPEASTALNPLPTPAAADQSATVRYSPTRPGTPAAEALESPPPPPVTPATTYSVVAGDNLWNIAKKHGTTVRELIKVNNLTNSSRLSVGQKLIIPGPSPAASAQSAVPSAAGAAYVVKPGDTLSMIARQVGSTTADIKRANHLTSDYLQVGQELRLPTEPMGPMPGAAPAAENRVEGSAVHVVRPGETLGGIAREYHVKVSALAIANNIADPKKIRAGQKLVIPGGKTPAAVKTPAKAKAKPSKAAPAQAEPGPAPAEETPSVAPVPAPATPAPVNQDLDTGLKESNNVPVIKVEGADTSKSQ